MARVTYGSLITELRGSIGGTVFQRNKYGYTAKNTPNMKFPNSSYVRDSQRLLVNAVKNWGAVSQSVRDAFNSYASSFPQYSYNNPTAQLSGYSIAVRWWYLLSMVGLPMYSSFSSISNSFASVTPVLDESAGDFYISIPSGSDPANILRAFFLSAPVQPTRNYKPSSFHYIGSTEYPVINIDCGDIYSNFFGNIPSVGENIFCKVIPFSKNCPQVLADQFFKIVVT